MRIRFSVYLENEDDGKLDLKFSDVVDTPMSVKEIDDYFQLYDMFRSELVVGHTLSFWDLYFWGSVPEDIVEKINKLPRGKTEYIEVYPRTISLHHFDPNNVDSPTYPDIDKSYFYTVSRFERGASGLGGILADIINNPIISGVVGSFIYDSLKRICKKMRDINDDYYEHHVIRFNSKKFMNRFHNITNIEKFNCQIVYMALIEDCKYEVHVRTVHDACFRVVTSARGDIYSVKEIPVRRDGCE